MEKLTSKEKVYSALSELDNLGLKRNYTNIAQYAKVSYPTAKKYYDEYKADIDKALEYCKEGRPGSKDIVITTITEWYLVLSDGVLVKIYEQIDEEKLNSNYLESETKIVKRLFGNYEHKRAKDYLKKNPDKKAMKLILP